jgi:hypothetical protein
VFWFLRVTASSTANDSPCLLSYFFSSGPVQSDSGTTTLNCPLTYGWKWDQRKFQELLSASRKVLLVYQCRSICQAFRSAIDGAQPRMFWTYRITSDVMCNATRDISHFIGKQTRRLWLCDVSHWYRSRGVSKIYKMQPGYHRLQFAPFNRTIMFLRSPLSLLSLLVLAAQAQFTSSSQISFSGLPPEVPKNSTLSDVHLFTPFGSLDALSETTFTTLRHPLFPDYAVRIKKSKFCNENETWVLLWHSVYSRFIIECRQVHTQGISILELGIYSIISSRAGAIQAKMTSCYGRVEVSGPWSIVS